MSKLNNLASLRNWMLNENVQAFLVPRTDMFFGEYVAPHNERLAWVSGFTGSAGFAIITIDKAYLFTDGRYTLQAHKQSPEFVICDFTSEAIAKITKEELTGSSLHYDAWLMSEFELEQWKKRINMIAVDKNPIDILWHDRPNESVSQAYDYNLEYAGESRAVKLAKLRAYMQKHDEHVWFISDPEIVCWLFNLRGSDLPNTPLLQAMALIDTNSVNIFCDTAKIKDDLSKQAGFKVLPLSDLEIVLKAQKLNICADSKNTAAVLVGAGINFVWKNNPCYLMRAQKNAIQQQGMRNCHVRDAAALLKFWHWLEEQQNTTEVKAQDYLYDCRANQDLFICESFPSISAFNANGAIVHYRSTPETDIQLTKGIYLLDSGGNYLDGTTDITRVFALGAQPSVQQKHYYTMVLKGHIALASIQFPKGTHGSQLDVLARQYLWNEGLDYSHGTGHGVSSCLSVHEWPQRIFSKGSNIPLEIGMVVSNEPGFYLEGEYGIRIENLQMVVPSEKNGFYQFETLTMVPYDNNLIAFELLNSYELSWLKKYYATIWEKLSPNFDKKDWLQKKLKIDSI
jgi:Xaa-Pro aminopeptidase